MKTIIAKVQIQFDQFSDKNEVSSEDCPNCGGMELELDESCPDCGREA